MEIISGVDSLELEFIENFCNDNNISYETYRIRDSWELYEIIIYDINEKQLKELEELI